MYGRFIRPAELASGTGKITYAFSCTYVPVPVSLSFFFFIFLFFNSKDTCKAVLILRNVPYKEWLFHLVKENEQEKNKMETRNNRDLEWCVSIY